MNVGSGIATWRYWQRQRKVLSKVATKSDRSLLAENLRHKSFDFDRIISSLELEGVSVLPGYWPTEKCAYAREEVDRLAAEYPSIVQHNSGGSDKRMFGVESVSPLLAEFHNDEFLRGVGEYLGGFDNYNFATLAARIDATNENNGSGDGWHRDAHGFQFKSILYLSDVTEDTGPFEYLPGSQKAWRAAFDSARGNLPNPPNSRYAPIEIDRMVDRFGIKRQDYQGTAGTLLLVNTAGIHRGRPLRVGSRYALTNYYYYPHEIDRARVENFPKMMPGTSERIIEDLRLP